MSATIPAIDVLRPFQLEASEIRGRFVRLGQSVDRVLKAHAYPQPVCRVLGELLVLASGLAGGLKFDGKFSLQIRGQGAIRLMVADCTNDGFLRGYASFDAAGVAALSADEDPVSLLGQGLLALTVDQAASGGETYQGIVELEGRSLADSMLAYFRRSEQVPTGIRMALEQDTNGAWRGGAIIVQALAVTDPAAKEAQALDWQEAMVLLGTATDDEITNPGLPLDTLLFRLFHETGVRVFEPQALAHGCSCDEERVERVLLSFSAEEVEEMRLPDGSIDVTCQFCNQSYHYEPARLVELFNTRRH
ncbi:molecular chaperone Hsp33 [Arboricoccus pini]|uniref:Molecular chaperone Hsp33 n=1 Tax=Arboricoccus pini TaxID=1963835 RepID=A0A212PZ58_9PROT|nr:Hsp33 family molecular chaperone HslO [Arboricoccus pini]SNB52238.1 molecular chaperone Hsp33 [Arboricoccus pini]